MGLGSRTGLRAALAARVLLPLGIVLGVTVLAGLHALETDIERRMKDDVDLVARALRLPLIHAMSRDREGSVREALRSAFRIGRVYGAYVFGPDGELVAAYGSAVPIGPPEGLRELVEVGDRSGAFGSVAGRRVYSSFVPLTDEWGRSVGLLQVTRRQRDFEEYIAGLRLWVMGALVLGMGIVTVLVLHGHHRAAVRPLTRLGSSMSRVGSGDAGHRAATDGPRELARLALSFNQMLDKLQSAASELQERRAERDALEQELAASEKLAAVGELSAGVAHELGTPLSVIDGRAQRWLRAEALSATMREDLTTIRAQVKRMEGIVRQLLEFGRAETGRKRVVDLGSVAHGAVSAVEGGAREAHLRLELRPPPAPVLVEADPRRLEEAIGNLLRNAIHAADDLIRISWYRCDSAVVLAVEDDGPGVEGDLRLRVFEPFFTTKESGEGSGLGLAVVRGVVDEHGGKTSVERSGFGGARFVVELPVCAGEDRGSVQA